MNGPLVARSPRPTSGPMWSCSRRATSRVNYVITVLGVIAGLTLLTVALFQLGGSTADTHASREATLAAAAALTLILWAPSLGVALHNPAAWASPLPLQAIGYTVFFLMPAVQVALDPAEDYRHLLRFYPSALALLGIGYPVLVLGYHGRLGAVLAAATRRSLPFPSYEPSSLPALAAALIMYAIGWTARLILIQKGVFYHTAASEYYFTPAANLLGQVAWLCKLAFIVLLVRWLRYPNAGGAALGVVAVGALEVGFGLVSGGRQIVAEVAVYSVVGYLTVRRKLPVVRWAIAIAALTLIFTMVAAYRYELVRYRRGGTAIGAAEVLSASSRTLNAVYRDPAWFADGLKQLVRRNSDITVVAAFVRDTPSVYPFEYGRTYLGIIFFFIPRALWPEKPSLIVGFETTQRYFPDSDPYNYASSPATLIGEFYINFGVGGVLLGMAFWGVFLRFLYEYAQTERLAGSGYLFVYLFSSSYMVWVSQTAGVVVAIGRMWLAVFALTLLAQMLGGPASRLDAGSPARPALSEVRRWLSRRP